MAKRSFILYHDQKEIVDELSDEQAGQLFKAIYDYNVNGKTDLTGPLKLVFISFRSSFDRNNTKWEQISKKRSEAGKRGMEKRWDQTEDITNDNKSYQKITTITASDSVSVSDSASVSDSVSVSVSVIPNTHDTVSQFAIEYFDQLEKSDLIKSSKKFFNYYQEKKWKGVTDWHEKLKMWIEDDLEQGRIREKEPDTVGEDGFKRVNGRRVI